MNPKSPFQAPAGDWPTYHGDSSGAHYSQLHQINRRSIERLGLAWTVRPTTSAAGAIEGGLSVAASAVGSQGIGFPTQLKATPVINEGVIYTVVGSQVQALDARTGRAIWRYHWRSPGSAMLGRGVALFEDSVIVQTGSDNYVVSLDAHTGRERWRKQVTDSSLGFAGSTAPVLAGRHLILGMGGDGNNLGPWLESRDPATGELQWRWFTTPRAGEAGIETWPDVEAANKGGGMPWQQVTYDPQLDFIYVPTANPVPVFNGFVRKGDNLYTNCIVALHAATGRMAWYFQPTPHDTHDYDASQVPILFDARFEGKPRKLLAQFNRNGYFFLLDRVTGKALGTHSFVDTINWAKGVKADGQPIPDPLKEPQPGGAVISPMSDGAANYPAPSYDPQTRLVYSHANTSFSIVYLDPTEEHPLGWGGGSEYHTGYSTSALVALDYATGRIAWKHAYPGVGFVTSAYPGLLTTAGGLLFTGDPHGNFIGFDAAIGTPLWHARIGRVRNPPVTYVVDGRQYLLVATDESFYAFALNER
ncbi:MAG: PQQ-binding-like beta-propeller repeat protein [Pseudomonadota bacterium]